MVCQNHSGHLPGLSITWGEEKGERAQTSLVLVQFVLPNVGPCVPKTQRTAQRSKGSSPHFTLFFSVEIMESLK